MLGAKGSVVTDVATTPRKAMSASRRLRIWEAHKGVCILCGLKIDGVREPWIVEHPRALALGGHDTDENAAPAHERCRRIKDKDDVARIAKAKRVKSKFIDRRQSRNPMPGSKASKWKRRMNGEVVLR